MLWNNEYVGIALDGDTLKLAYVRKEGNGLQLIKLDSYSLVEEIDQNADETASVFEGAEATASQEAGGGDIFGFDQPKQETSSGQDLEGEVDFEDLEAETNAEPEEEDLMSLDMVDEAEGPRSNAIMLYNILSEIDADSLTLGLNIPAGETIFQVIDDTDFRDAKTKDLVEDLESKLESIYGEPKSPDRYAYDIREDGSLILASVQDEPSLLSVVNESREFYGGKMKINSIYPDEIALVNLARQNYRLDSTQITGLLQFSKSSCRIVFLEGEKIIEVPGLINRGTASNNFLNTVFSKILFQLDTGTVPGIDQIIIANNSLGEEAVQFFRQNFPDTTVQEFQYNEEVLDHGNTDQDTLNNFTTAIATAWAAADIQEEASALSFLPDYVRERQKIFKLQWHGILLLLLIFLAPITINYFYQQNANQIESLSNELERTNSQINQITPIVNSTNELAADLALLTSKLGLLDSLSVGSKAWSTKMGMLNEGMNGIPNSWFTTMSPTQNGTFLEGYSLYRNRIPAIVDLFAEGTLLNVNIEEVREEEIFRFSMVVQQFAKDPSVYSPEKPPSIQQILNN